MIPWLREPSLAEKLRRELRETKEARIGARAQAAHWINREQFLLSEVQRLEDELNSLTDQTVDLGDVEAQSAFVAAKPVHPDLPELPVLQGHTGSQPETLSQRHFDSIVAKMGGAGVYSR